MSEHDDEILRTREPSDDILCRTCKSRLKQIERVPTLKRWKYGTCHMYEVKPHGVLWENEMCPSYEKE